MALEAPARLKHGASKIAVALEPICPDVPFVEASRYIYLVPSIAPEGPVLFEGVLPE